MDDQSDRKRIGHANFLEKKRPLSSVTYGKIYVEVWSFFSCQVTEVRRLRMSREEGGRSYQLENNHSFIVEYWPCLAEAFDEKN